MRPFDRAPSATDFRSPQLLRIGTTGADTGLVSNRRDVGDPPLENQPAGPHAHGSDCRESEELHRLVLESISDAVFVTDDDGAFTFVCPNAHVIFGYSAEDVHRMGNISQLLGPDLFDPKELAARGELRHLEHTITNASRQEVDLIVNVKRVSIGPGTVLYTCRDVSELKRFERALRASEAKYRLLFESAQDAILTLKEDRIVDCNSRVVDLLARPRSEISGRPLWFFSPPSQRDGADSRSVARRILRHAFQGNPILFDWLWQTDGGELMDVEISLTRLPISDDPTLLAHCRPLRARTQRGASPPPLPA